METLTELGRHEICKRFGIQNKDSRLVVDRVAFIDRMTLLNVMFNTQKIIDVYKEEMRQFGSEEEYIEFLNKRQRVMYDFITVVLRTMINNWTSYIDKLGDTTNYSKHRLSDDICSVKISIPCPVYESVRFLIQEAHINHNSIKEFVLYLTGSEFLATIDDLDINMFKDKNVVRLIEVQQLALSNIMHNLVCPKYINHKSILDIEKTYIRFESTENKTAESIQRLYDMLTNNEVYSMSEVSIELYNTKQLASNSNMYMKKSLLPNHGIDAYNIEGYSELELLRYLRNIYKQPISEVDNIIQVNGSEALITSENKVAWY